MTLLQAAGYQDRKDIPPQQAAVLTEEDIRIIEKD
jgi:hypothetical protein